MVNIVDLSSRAHHLFHWGQKCCNATQPGKCLLKVKVNVRVGMKERSGKCFQELSSETRTKQSPKAKGTFKSSKSNLNQGSFDFHLERGWTDREKGFQEVSVQLSPSTSQRGASLRSTTSSRLKTARLAVIAVEVIGSSIFVPTTTNILHFLTGLANTHL